MRPRGRDDFAIAIICALPLEAEAVEALFDKTYDRLGKHYGKQRGDANAYINGRVGKHDVVLCYMPGMGKGSAAAVASSLLVSYTSIQLALVVGICGGAPSPPKYEEIFLGDVIISDSVIEYDFGRQYPSGFQRKSNVKDTLGRPGREIRALLNGLRTENARRDLQDQTQDYEAVEQAFMSIASLVGLQNMEPAEVKERLQAYFSQTDEKWILIFDNADEMDMWFRGNPPAPPLKNIIPRSENGHVLFTSRNRQLALKLAAANIVSIPDVDQKTGKEILKKLLVQKDLLRDDQMANALLEKLAFLPLAISQAAAYINQNSISLAGYMSLLGEQEASTIEMLSEEFEDDGRYAEIQNPVAMTWLVSFIQIQQVDQIASDYLFSKTKG
ncbi:hypothetical protein CBS12448_1644 [Aspergillus niger]|nr:hypothetical protein CBS12448_1644 [Aspergillus niger]